MIEATPLSVRFTNRLQGYLKAQRILYRQGMMAKVDKGVALFVFGFDLCVVFFVGLRGWTVIWLSHLFLLMYGKALYALIPKRCFHSSEEIDRFCTLLSQMASSPKVCSA